MCIDHIFDSFSLWSLYLIFLRTLGLRGLHCFFNCLCAVRFYWVAALVASQGCWNKASQLQWTEEQESIGSPCWNLGFQDQGVSMLQGL